MKNNKKIWMYTVLVIVMAIVVGGILHWNKSVSEKTENTETETTQTDSEKNEATTDDSVSDDAFIIREDETEVSENENTEKKSDVEKRKKRKIIQIRLVLKTQNKKLLKTVRKIPQEKQKKVWIISLRKAR